MILVRWFVRLVPSACSQRVSSSTPQGPCFPRVLASDVASGHFELTSINSIDISGQRHQPSEAGDEGKVIADAGTSVFGSRRHTTSIVTQRGSSSDPTQEQGPANYSNIGVRKTEEEEDLCSRIQFEIHSNSGNCISVLFQCQNLKSSKMISTIRICSRMQTSRKSRLVKDKE